MIVITDILKKPYDEGFKVAVYNLLQAYKKKYPCKIISVNADDRLPFIDVNLDANKMLFSKQLYSYVKCAPNINILYVPEASITSLSLVRAKLIKYFTGKEVNILSLQPRAYNLPARLLSSAIRPKCVITQSPYSANGLDAIGIKAKILPLGVDDKKFSECKKRKKIELRKKYGLDIDGKILLHVGHIKKKRNIDWLIEVKRYLRQINILIIGSTTTDQEEGLLDLLEENAIIVFRYYIPSIEEIYQLADYYAFPVQDKTAAIETPLSVLEAMATNLPVLTTHFGSLPETFEEDECFRFIDSPADIVAVLKNGFPDHCNNREKTRPYTWENIADKLHEIIYFKRNKIERGIKKRDFNLPGWD